MTDTPAETEIPEDIRYIAQHVCGYVEAMPSDGNVNVIANAILAERERCAQIAKGIGQAYRTVDATPVRSAVADEIAKHINPHSSKLSSSQALTDSPALPLPLASGTPFESDVPKSLPGDAAASQNSPRQERPSAEERSSDRSGGQFGDAPKPAHIQREVAR